jgi:hypothetical protein
LQGCAQGKHPFLMVQTCLGSAQGLFEFERELRVIARLEGMRFIDGTAEATTNREALGVAFADRPTFFVSLRRGDGSGLMAVDLGPDYQVAVGFSEGSSTNGARAFAERVVDRLEQRWPVRVVSEGEGAQALENCEAYDGR